MICRAGRIYDQSLIEAYDDAARFYLNRGESAAGAGEALQISRINSGLYSEQQLLLVKALIDARSRIEQWQEVDDLRTQLIISLSVRCS